MLEKSDAPISIMLGDGNPLVLSAMSEIFDRDLRFWWRPAPLLKGSLER